MPWDFVSSRPLKNFTKYSLKLIANGGTNWTTENIGFFSFFTKKTETTFFQVLPHFLGFFFLVIKKPWNILGINDCTSNVFDIDLQDFFLIWLQHLLFPFFNFIVPMHVLIVSVSHVVPVFVPFFLNYNESSIEESSPIQTQKFSDK